MKIAVIDGLGGGLGSQIISRFKEKNLDKVELIALGTNAQATSRMISQGADRGATGENAIQVMSSEVDLIIGPVGIIIPNSMMGEVSTTIAETIAGSEAEKFLLSNRQPHVNFIGMADYSLNEMIDELITEVNKYIST